MIPIEQHNIPPLEQINTPCGRFYKSESGAVYPSVTTVLGSIPNPGLEAWKKSVGEVKAKQISKSATDRGTLIHAWCEAFILDEPIDIKPTQHIAGEMFRNMIPELIKFQEVHALETRLWSDNLKIAGSVDCIAFIAGELYVVDFKTSNSFKSKKDIPTYFMQCSAYAMAWYERTGMPIRKIRIIITTQDDGVLVYDEDVTTWLPEFVKVRKNYVLPIEMKGL